MSGSTGAYVIGFLLMPIITRIYSLDNFGIMTLFGTIVLTVSVVACGSYEQAIVLPKEDSDAWVVFVLSLIICVCISFFSLLILFIFHQPISRLIFKIEIFGWLWLIPLAIFLSGLRLILNYWATRKKEFHSISISKVFESLGNSGIKLISGLAFGNNLGGLIFGILGRSFFPDIILGVNIYKRDLHTIMRIPDKHELFWALKKYRNFPYFSSWAALLVNIARSIPVFCLAFLFDNKVVGAFGLADNTLRLPVSLIGQSIRQVYLQRAANLKSEKKNFQLPC